MFYVRRNIYNNSDTFENGTNLGVVFFNQIYPHRTSRASETSQWKVEERIKVKANLRFSKHIYTKYQQDIHINN